MERHDRLSRRTLTSASRPRAISVAPAEGASVLRCLAVWAALTTLSAAGTALGVGAVADTLHTLVAPTSVDQALVMGAGIGAAVLCPWLWLVATLSVVDALRGRVPARAGWTRRLTLLACGVVVTTSVASPSHAATESLEPGGAAETISLSGLPYPDRVSSKQHGHEQQKSDRPLPVSARAVTAPDRTAGSTHRVRSGDTLWAIAAASATRDTDLPGAVAELHLRNRRVIGADPDLIRPGQVLDLHSEGDEPR